MLEDDFYRTSSQYRLWSFTPESLRSLRENTNAAAAQRVREAIQRARQSRQSSGRDGYSEDQPMGGTNENADKACTATAAEEIDTLTMDEELELVRYFCEMTIELSDKFGLPTMVRATAVQYLRRFYLSNSPMTYHPKTIMPCALFLATKTDNYVWRLDQFASKIPHATPADIIAPEFLLTQSLRYAFDVRHPFRGLEGGTLELVAISRGEYVPGPHHPEQSPAELQKAIRAVPSAVAGEVIGSVTHRVYQMHDRARDILKTAAQFTDVYFHYTPSQIWLAAFLLTDRPLAEFYLDTKLALPSPSPDSPNPLAVIRARAMPVLDACASIMSTYFATHAPNDKPALMGNLKRIGKKLYHCQNPDKKAQAAAGKRGDPNASANANANANDKDSRDYNKPNPDQTEASDTPMADTGAELNGSTPTADHLTKKRKVEQGHRFNADDVFGGELVRPK